MWWRGSGAAVQAPHLLQREVVGNALVERLTAIAETGEDRPRRGEIAAATSRSLSPRARVAGTGYRS